MFYCYFSYHHIAIIAFANLSSCYMSQFFTYYVLLMFHYCVLCYNILYIVFDWSFIIVILVSFINQNLSNFYHHNFSVFN